MNKEDLKNKRILGVDYGRKFTGLGIYAVGIDPYPLMHGRIKYQDDNQLLEELQNIIDTDFVDLLVIGIPYFTDGKSSTMTKTVEDFINLAKSKVEVPIYTPSKVSLKFTKL